LAPAILGELEAVLVETVAGRAIGLPRWRAEFEAIAEVVTPLRFHASAGIVMTIRSLR